MTPSILGWMCIRQRSRRRFWIPGKLVMESILETKAATILQFMQSARRFAGNLRRRHLCGMVVQGLLKPHVRQVLVYDPRKNALLKVGNKSDRIDARKLAELLRSNCCARCISGFLLVFLSKNASDLLLALTEHCLAEAFPIKASDDSGFI